VVLLPADISVLFIPSFVIVFVCLHYIQFRLQEFGLKVIAKD
jgi:hypothetical protein